MVKVGLIGVGLATYWPQFPGLKARLEGYLERTEAKVRHFHIDVENCGIIDSLDASQDALDRLLKARVDILFINISTYALSKNVLPLVRQLGKPVIILNLQPESAIDYSYINGLSDRGKMTGEWLAYCQSCVAPELSSVFQRSGLRFQMVTGFLEDSVAWKEIAEWIQAVTVVSSLRNLRAGLLGHYYNGMLDVYSDLTQLSACFGTQFEIVEIGELKHFRDQIAKQELQAKILDFQQTFLVSPECSTDELQRAAMTSIAIEKMVSQYKLGALAYYYEGLGDMEYEDIVTSFIPGFTLLTGRNIPVAGEYEVKNLLAMKIMDLLGAGGSFSEFYAVDFDKDIVLLGHDGPAHFAIADGKVGLVPVPVYHGKPGKGLSIQMKVKNGPVTLLSVCQRQNGSICLLTAEGISEEGPTLQIGNTNSRYRFTVSARDFINRWSMAGPSHHCAIGVGQQAGNIRKIGWLLGIDVIEIS